VGALTSAESNLASCEAEVDAATVRGGTEGAEEEAAETTERAVAESGGEAEEAESECTKPELDDRDTDPVCAAAEREEDRDRTSGLIFNKAFEAFNTCVIKVVGSETEEELIVLPCFPTGLLDSV